MVKGKPVSATFLPTGTAISGFTFDDMTFFTKGTRHANDLIRIVGSFDLFCCFLGGLPCWRFLLWLETSGGITCHLLPVIR